MISAPAAATSSGNMALTVAPVPTGMKAVVRTSPRGVRIAPLRAAPSRALTAKEKRSVICASCRAEQTGVAIGIEAVALRDGMVISALHQIEPREGCGQHE